MLDSQETQLVLTAVLDTSTVVHSELKIGKICHHRSSTSCRILQPGCSVSQLAHVFYESDFIAFTNKSDDASSF